MRATLMVLGLALTGYGTWLVLSEQDLGGVAELAAWWAGGVVLHDLVLVPLLLLAGAVVARLLPSGVRRPLAWWLVVAGPLTLLAIPVLGRFGARPDNPTLLDRPYVAGWLALVALTGLGCAIAGVLAARRSA